MVTHSTVTTTGSTETGASPSEKVALGKVVDHGPETDSTRVTMAAKPAAAVVEPGTLPIVTSQTAPPGASMSQQLVLGRAEEARAPKRVKVLLGAIVLLLH